MFDPIIRAHHQEDIQAYYRETRAHYRWMWSPDHLHYGYWETGIETNEAALKNMVTHLFSWANLSSLLLGICLDAGCGVGGTIRQIDAEATAANKFLHGYGLTLSREQAEEGRKLMGGNINWMILQGDYEDPPFRPQVFDRIWFLESFCYALDPVATLKTMWGLLRPGGVLTIVDGFRGDGFLGPADEALFQDWAQGWAVRDLARPADLEASLLRLGAQHVRWRDITKHVLPSSEILYRRARRARWWLRWGWGTEWQKANIRSASLQREVFAKQLMRYGVLTADKPL